MLGYSVKSHSRRSKGLLLFACSDEGEYEERSQEEVK
jgi:hypothetical protein